MATNAQKTKTLAALEAAILNTAAIFNRLNEGTAAMAAASAIVTEATTAALNDRPTLATRMLCLLRDFGAVIQTRTKEGKDGKPGTLVRYLDKDSEAAKALAKHESLLLAKVIGAETDAAKTHHRKCFAMALDAYEDKLTRVTAKEPKADGKAKRNGKVAAAEEATATDRLFAALAKGKAVPAQPDAASPFGAAWAVILQAYGTASTMRAARIARSEKHAKNKAAKAAKAKSK